MANLKEPQRLRDLSDRGCWRQADHLSSPAALPAVSCFSSRSARSRMTRVRRRVLVRLSMPAMALSGTHCARAWISSVVCGSTDQRLRPLRSSPPWRRPLRLRRRSQLANQRLHERSRATCTVQLANWRTSFSNSTGVIGLERGGRFACRLTEPSGFMACYKC
jgi:hypothetical protein